MGNVTAKEIKRLGIWKYWDILEYFRTNKGTGNEKEKENHLKVFSWIATRSIIFERSHKAELSSLDCDEYLFALPQT